MVVQTMELPTSIGSTRSEFNLLPSFRHIFQGASHALSRINLTAWHAKARHLANRDTTAGRFGVSLWFVDGLIVIQGDWGPEPLTVLLKVSHQSLPSLSPTWRPTESSLKLKFIFQDPSLQVPKSKTHTPSIWELATRPTMNT